MGGHAGNKANAGERMRPRGVWSPAVVPASGAAGQAAWSMGGHAGNKANAGERMRPRGAWSPAVPAPGMAGRPGAARRPGVAGRVV